MQMRREAWVILLYRCKRAFVLTRGGGERFRTLSACAWPIGLLRPTARVVFAGSNLEDLKAKEPNWFLRVIFVGSINLR